jgi:hypothetical protein
MEKTNVKHKLKEINPQSFKINYHLCKEKEYILEVLKCQNCPFLLSKPRLCLSCSNMFCQDCSKTPSCPKCSESFKDGIIQTKLINLLNATKVTCPNTECNEEIHYADVIRHIEKCKFTSRIATCPGCLTDIKTTNEEIEIKQHISFCPSICEPCVYCKLDYKRKDMQQHHIVCDERFVKCIECDEMVLFREFEVHTRIESANKIILEYEEKIKKVRIEYEKNIIRRETKYSDQLNEYMVKLMEKNTN